MGVAEAWLGAALMIFAALDVLLTILYAKIGDRGLSRFGAGVGSVIVARTVWAGLRFLARPLGRHRQGLLSLAGPLSVLCVLVLWMVTLVVGAALIIHPALGHTVHGAGPTTPTDFPAALYAAAASLSLSSASDMTAQGSLRLLYVVDSLTGTFMVALVISYVMPVYNALRDRNSLALSLDLLSRETGEAAELIAGLGPHDDFGAGQSVLADLAMRMTSLKEAHHFYPLLFYFHTSLPAHSLVRCLRLSLDTVSLLRSCLDERHVLRSSGSLWQLQRATMLLVETVSAVFVPARLKGSLPDEGPQAHWREHYLQSRRTLAAAGIALCSDADGGGRAYDVARAEWDAQLRRIGVYLAHDEDDPDRRSAELAARDERQRLRETGQPAQPGAS